MTPPTPPPPSSGEPIFQPSLPDAVLLPAKLVEPQSPLRAIVSWLVIAGCVALMIGVTIVRKGMPKEFKGPTAQHLISARYAVGTMSITRAMTGNPSANTGRQLARQARDGAKTDVDKLYAAIITAAVDSKDDARPLLDGLSKSADEATARDATDVLAILNDGSASLDADARVRLTDRHGWIGRLALTLDLPPGDPDRRAVLADGEQTSIVLFGFIAVLAVVALLGLALFITGIVMFAIGSMRTTPTSAVGRDVALLEAFALYLALISSSILWNAFGLPGGRVIGTVLAFGSFAVGLAWPFIRRAASLNPGDVRQAMGLHSGRGFFVEAFFGVAGYIALFPLMVVGITITAYLSRVTGTDASHPITELIVGPLWQFVLVAVLAAVFAPITEELMFRGALFGHLRTRLPWFVAAMVVALVFASIHPQGWAGIPALSMIGLNLALLRQWRGSIVASVTAHALNNGTLVLLTGLMLR